MNTGETEGGSGINGSEELGSNPNETVVASVAASPENSKGERYKREPSSKKCRPQKIKTTCNVPAGLNSYLVDARLASRKYADECTLIIVEGESAKLLARRAQSLWGKDKYGVFALRGKIRNVWGRKQITSTAITNLLKALGLWEDKIGLLQDETAKQSLRYRGVMIMTDQDPDGIHIKGLLINLFYNVVPHLLKNHMYISEFITPLFKVQCSTGPVKLFYSTAVFSNWEKNMGSNEVVGVTYYKGLGSIEWEDCVNFFENFSEHHNKFFWDARAEKALELAFCKKMKIQRFDWARKQGTDFVDRTRDSISYYDFLHIELQTYAYKSLQRAVPSLMDGLKPVHRKIWWSALKKKPDGWKVKVNEFCGHVSEESAYRHGDTSLSRTIIRMAQNFVGSNNYPILTKVGEFGSREDGGIKTGSPRYIRVRLSVETKQLIKEEDDMLLDYQFEGTKFVEPTLYLPIAPLILMNGCKGIACGIATYIPRFSVHDIAKNIMCFLDKKEMEDMIPWYTNFKGTITIDKKEADGSISYKTEGQVSVLSPNSSRDRLHVIHITELPIGMWTAPYLEFLKKHTSVKIVSSNHLQSNSIDIKLTRESKAAPTIEELKVELRLISYIHTRNMYLYTPTGEIKKYPTAKENFCKFRFEQYEKRLANREANMQKNLEILSDKIRFRKAMCDGAIKRGSESEICSQLTEAKYSKFSQVSHGVSTTENFNHILKMEALDILRTSNMAEDEKTKEELEKGWVGVTAEDEWKSDLRDLIERWSGTGTQKRNIDDAGIERDSGRLSRLKLGD